RRLDQVSAMNLNNFDVVFIMGSERINNIARVKEFVNNGGKIVFMPGTNSSLSNFQKLCQELKVNVPTNIVGKLNDVSTKVSFGSVDYEHPIFVDLFQKNVKKQIESPDINYYFKTPVKSNSKTIISLLDNSVFLSETEFENGKVILFTSAPTFKCSNFPLKGIFAPLMNKLVFYLSARNKEIKDYIVGQSFPIKLVSLLGNQLLINKPNNNQEFINLDSLKQMNYFDYKNTDIAGSYSILNNNRIIENASFNTNPLESRLGKMSDSEFDEYLNKINFQGKLFTVQINDDYKKLIYSSRFGSELWRYFLLIALLLALVEMFIARSSKKDLIGLDDKQK
ncbi:MAG: hypothetical protein JXA68_11750, partial [Ignavibacteriales bacterium]|nr:hypothetical protein [Ignavibacteriales bacterium]